MKPKLYPFALLFISIHLFSTLSKAQPGSINTSFGSKGLVKQRFYSNSNAFNETATDIIHLADGKSLISLSVNDRTILTRITATGAIDFSYGINGYSDYVRLVNSSMGLGADGSIYVAGYSGSGFGLAHFDSQGNLDKSFGVNGVVTTFFDDKIAYVQTLVAQPDGRIVLTGHLYNGKNYDLALARYNANGSLDSAFGTNGKVSTDFGYSDYGYAAAIQADGKILVSGGITTANGFNNMSVVRYTANGKPDPHFGNAGKIISLQNVSQAAHAVKVQPDGKIVVAGGNVNFILLRYNSDGSPDLTFAKNGRAETDFGAITEVAVKMEVGSDGRITVAGDVRNASGITNSGLVRYYSNGLPDENFGNLGKTTVAFGSFISNVKAIKIGQYGKITAAGAVQSGNGKPRDYALFRCEANGALDKTFGTGGQITGFVDAENAEFRSIAAQGDRKIIVGGFSDGANDPDFALARYNTDGTPDISFGKNGKVVNNFGLSDVINALALFPDGKILAAGNIKVSPENTDFLLVRYNANGSLDGTFGTGGKIVSSLTPFAENLHSIAVQPDNKILAGGATSTSAGQNFILTRYHHDGTPDYAFGQHGKISTAFGYTHAFLVSIKVLASGKILTLARALNTNTVSTDIILAQYNPDGTPDASFGQGGTVIINFGLTDAGQSMEVLADGKIVVGGFIDVKGSNTDFILLRYHANGKPDLSFGEGGKVSTDFGFRDIGESISIQPNGKIILIGHSYSASGYNLCLARYHPDGSADAAFGEKGKVITDWGGDDVFTKSAIIGDSIYITGSIRQLTSYASIVSYSYANKATSVQFSCPADVIATTNKDACSAVISDIDPVLAGEAATAIHYTLSGATSGAGMGTASGKTFNKGVTNITYTQPGDPSKACTFTVTVEDQQVPVITSCPAVPVLCYSASGVYTIPKIAAADNCGSVIISYSITGATTRTGNGNDASGTFSTGVSTIMWTVMDENGNTTTCRTPVTVNGPIVITIPDAKAVSKGVDLNTVYPGYKPASSITLTAQVTGGTAPYSYSWSNGAATSSAVVNPPATGIQTVTITDAAGCKQSEGKRIAVVDVRCGNTSDKVQICHIPPGNPRNAKTNCVAMNSVAVMLANGSTLGACKNTTPITNAIKGGSLEMVAEKLSVQPIPNPTTDYFNLSIQSSSQIPLRISVLDRLGRVVEQKTNIPAMGTVQMGHNYPSGIYFAEVMQGAEKVTVKLIKAER